MIIFLIVLNNALMTQQNVISLPQGQFRGIVRSEYVSYTGIPYGTPNPMERFMKAGLAPIWSDIRDSTSSTCSTVSEVKNCLLLDVHLPSVTGDPWPVLVWVTGGSGPYNPGKLVQQGIIVVIVHHRTGPLGFLCLGDEKIPGNAGIKDVIAALRWVQDNIVAFKGNPAKIVIGGQGFGAAIVDAITLSNAAVGLYHGAILQSGSSLCPWAFNYDAEDRAKALENGDLDGDLVESLVDTNIEELVARSNKMNKPYFPFGICVEKPLKKEERVIINPPYELIMNKRGNATPIIIGYNSNEAYVFMSLFKEANVIKRVSRQVNFILPDELQFLNERERAQVKRQVKEVYFKKNVTIDSVLAYHRDAYFSSHIHRSVARYSSLSSVYYYQFSYSGDVGVQPEPRTVKRGAAHSDELAYLFYDTDLEGKDGDIQRQMLKLWSNFVKYLNPTPANGDFTWEPTKPNNFKLLDIDSNIKMMDYPHAKASHMWDDIYDKYYYTRNIAN